VHTVCGKKENSLKIFFIFWATEP